MTAREPTELVSAHRADRRAGIGLGLCPALHGLAEQWLDILCGLGFEMAEIFITGQHAPVNRLFQRTRRTRRQYGQWFG